MRCFIATDYRCSAGSVCSEGDVGMTTVEAVLSADLLSTA